MNTAKRVAAHLRLASEVIALGAVVTELRATVRELTERVTALEADSPAARLRQRVGGDAALLHGAALDAPASMANQLRERHRPPTPEERAAIERRQREESGREMEKIRRGWS